MSMENIPYCRCNEYRGNREGVARLFSRGPDSKYFQFASHMVSVAVTQLCHYSVKEAIGHRLKCK